MSVCPVCWRLVEPTVKRNVGHHRDKLGVEVCPASGEPFRIVGMVEAHPRPWVRDRLQYQRPRTVLLPRITVRPPANSGRTPLVRKVVV